MSVLGALLGASAELEVRGEPNVGAILGALKNMDAEQLDALQDVVGKHRRKHHGHHGHDNPLAIEKASWRGKELAPGINVPGEGHVPLPMLPLQNNGVFQSTQPTITFQGAIQKPYKARRFLYQQAASGGNAASAIVLGQIFVGTDLQQAQLQPIPLAVLGAPTLFDGYMSLMQATPGVIVSILCSLAGTGIGDTSTLTVVMFWLGHVMH